MAEPASAAFRLTKHQTAQALEALEVRKYGRRLNAEELAQKASVDLDSVNRVELHLPIADDAVFGRIANALGITTDLLGKVAGLAEMSSVEWQTLEICLSALSHNQPVLLQCERIGMRPLGK